MVAIGSTRTLRAAAGDFSLLSQHRARIGSRTSADRYVYNPITLTCSYFVRLRIFDIEVMIPERRTFSAGNWISRWKQQIDRRFIAKLNA
jgi:hypothetical protein